MAFLFINNVLDILDRFDCVSHKRVLGLSTLVKGTLFKVQWVCLFCWLLKKNTSCLRLNTSTQRHCKSVLKPLPPDLKKDTTLSCCLRYGKVKLNTAFFLIISRLPLSVERTHTLLNKRRVF